MPGRCPQRATVFTYTAFVIVLSPFTAIQATVSVVQTASLNTLIINHSIIMYPSVKEDISCFTVKRRRPAFSGLCTFGTLSNPLQQCHTSRCTSVIRTTEIRDCVLFCSRFFNSMLQQKYYVKTNRTGELEDFNSNQKLPLSSRSIYTIAQACAVPVYTHTHAHTHAHANIHTHTHNHILF
jgi:hypothetical protein